MKPQDRIMVALDVSTLEEAQAHVRLLSGMVGCFKVGLELLTSIGAPKVVESLHQLGGDLFYDGKFDDIPNTVGQAAKAAARLGVKYFNVHACCGKKAIAKAAENKGNSKLLVVTVLTSQDEAETQRIFGDSLKNKVTQFAKDALDAGADGIVCSPRDIPWIEEISGHEKLLKVTPGVRPTWAEAGDQSRVITPAEAIRIGATHLVIGRPILAPPKSIGGPKEALAKILEEMGNG